MTTTTFDTTVNTIISDALDLNSIFDAYNYFSSLNTEGLLTDLVGSDSTTILNDLQNAGVSDSTFDRVNEVISDFNGTVLGYLFSSNLQYNINGTTSALIGGDSNDALFNIDADDSTLNGKGGDDLIINFGSGNNTLMGGSGDDFIANVGTGNNVLKGGSGEDILLNIGTGNNQLWGGNGNDILINASSGKNTLSGGKGNDTLINFGSGATLKGGNGKDTLIGGNGNDKLVGGQGNDVLTGGDGGDTFTLSYGLSFGFSGWLPMLKWTNSGHDIITDFNASEGDVLQIDMTGFFDGLNFAGALSFDGNTGELSLAGTTLVTLEGVTSFDVNSVAFV